MGNEQQKINECIMINKNQWMENVSQKLMDE